MKISDYIKCKMNVGEGLISNRSYFSLQTWNEVREG